MGIVAKMAQRVMVMYGGKIVESGDVRTIFHNPGHPYTRSLLSAVPRLDNDSREPLEYIVGAPPDMLAPPAAAPLPRGVNTLWRRAIGRCRRFIPLARATRSCAGCGMKELPL